MTIHILKCPWYTKLYYRIKYLFMSNAKKRAYYDYMYAVNKMAHEIAVKQMENGKL